MTWRDPRIVLVPVDFSAAAKAAVREAVAFTGDARRVHVTHILQPMTPNTPGVIWGDVDEATRRKNVVEALHKDLPYEDMQLHVRFGDPGREIAELADELDVDLVIMPSHGRSGLPRLLLGSVAERVLRLSRRPVLVLRHHALTEGEQD